jgi:hypothetical protein
MASEVAPWSASFLWSPQGLQPLLDFGVCELGVRSWVENNYRQNIQSEVSVILSKLLH